MTARLKITTLILFLASCSPSIEKTEFITNQLGGRWKLIGVFQNGIQITDTIGTTELQSPHDDYIQFLYNISTDSGLHNHIYRDEDLFAQKIARPRIIEFKLEENYGTSREYILIGNQITKEQEFVVKPDTFRMSDSNGAFLQYIWGDMKLFFQSKNKLVIPRSGKEYHYEKFGNGL